MIKMKINNVNISIEMFNALMNFMGIFILLITN